MAGQNRRSASDIKTDPKAGPAPNPAHAPPQDLVSNGPAYTYFQAMRLLHHCMPAASKHRQHNDAPIRVRPALHLAFPAADIQAIEAVHEGHQTRYHVTTNFFGLYGTSSPLPTFYSEDLIAEKGRDESVSRDFIDILHQRLYDLLFHSRLKYRQFFQVAEHQSEPYMERLFCLLGLGDAALRRQTPDAQRLLRYIGLFTQYPRSAAGLATLLKDDLSDVPIALVPCVSRMAAIDDSQRMKIGMTGSALGEDTYIGQEIEDRMGKFRIRIGPLAQADFLRFTPGKPDYERLTALTQLYLVEPLEYDIELILTENQAQTVCLGDPDRAALGVTCWVFSEQTLGEVCTRFAVAQPKKGEPQ
jgi:type VI secretion system protein ImpH